MLAGGWRALYHATDGLHQGSGNRRAQRRHVPHAGVRRTLDRHALAAAQRGGAALPRGGAAQEEAAGGGRARSRPGPRIFRDGADARRARRADARRVPAARSRGAREVRDDRHGSAGERPDHSRRLRGAGGTPAGRAVRRSHRVLLPPGQLPGLPSHLHHPPHAPDLPDHRRRHPPDGGLLPRHGQRADLPAAHPQDAARDRRHAFPGRRDLSQHRHHLDRQALPGARAQNHERVLGSGAADVLEDRHRGRQRRQRSGPCRGCVDRRHPLRPRARHSIHARPGR